MRPPRESVGALAALLRYQRERRAGNALVGGVVDGLDRLFTRPPGLAAAGWPREGMALVARSPLARRAAGQASGSWSIFAAQMKSFSDSPLMACVVKRTRQ